MGWFIENNLLKNDIKYKVRIDNMPEDKKNQLLQDFNALSTNKKKHHLNLTWDNLKKYDISEQDIVSAVDRNPDWDRLRDDLCDLIDEGTRYPYYVYCYLNKSDYGFSNDPTYPISHSEPDYGFLSEVREQDDGVCQLKFNNEPQSYSAFNLVIAGLDRDEYAEWQDKDYDWVRDEIECRIEY